MFGMADLVGRSTYVSSYLTHANQQHVTCLIGMHAYLSPRE